MKLSKVALLVLKGSKDLKERIAAMMGVKLVTVYSWVQKNDDNLTKAAVLQMISEETGLQESDLLESDRAIA
jgi:transposase